MANKWVGELYGNAVAGFPFVLLYAPFHYPCKNESPGRYDYPTSESQNLKANYKKSAVCHLLVAQVSKILL